MEGYDGHVRPLDSLVSHQAVRRIEFVEQGKPAEAMG